MYCSRFEIKCMYNMYVKKREIDLCKISIPTTVVTCSINCNIIEHTIFLFCYFLKFEFVKISTILIWFFILWHYVWIMETFMILRLKKNSISN